ncbi:serine/threonine-protein kinase [Geothrix alkalitolerans]|uniref:serine/threonine-protein kinase n=1 Tax=Geothrix alkalitolerans TaxID=2922724 RepID=UPI001FB02441|nr:serine/threonine-protein kinase [Geothrix alkalitolerans]
MSTVAKKPERYHFEAKPHGSGGFGKIIKGHDNDLERDIAIKVLSDEKGIFSASSIERFRREARILAKLSHPNIPAIYDVVLNDDAKNFLIIFQFVGGQNLRQIIDSEGKCRLPEVRVWFHQLASAIEYAHSMGVIHRDIKPENVIISQDRENACLVDFGIALSSEDSKKLTDYGYAIGTPGYMSPEQLAGKEIDSKTDLYSLGVTLYEALAGKAIPVGDYEELSTVDESIPPQIDELIQECLAPAERRVPSAKAFSTRLATSLRVTRSLSEVLAHGRLHEVAGAIEQLDADDFSRLPKGQRALILLKCEDVVDSGEESLRSAGISFLDTLLRIGIHLSKEDYRKIVKPSIDWAYEQSSFGRQGNSTLQLALERAAGDARPDSHSVLAEEFIQFIKDKKLESKPNWYLQVLRNFLNSLLANQICDTYVTELSGIMREVNRIQRAR